MIKIDNLNNLKQEIEEANKIPIISSKIERKIERKMDDKMFEEKHILKKSEIYDVGRCRSCNKFFAKYYNRNIQQYDNWCYVSECWYWYCLRSFHSQHHGLKLCPKCSLEIDNLKQEKDACKIIYKSKKKAKNDPESLFRGNFHEKYIGKKCKKEIKK